MERIAFLFTGQGAQFTGMTKNFYDSYAVAKRTFEEASDILGMDMAKLCFTGSLVQLSKTENTQPALLIAGVATYRVFRQEIGLTPEFCAGHSLGEYTALVCAGAIAFPAALKLVQTRGKLCGKVADSGTGGMTIVEGLTQDSLEEVCKENSLHDQIVSINIYNSPTQFSIAGHDAAVRRAESCLKKKGARVTPLLFNAPFHSPLLAAIAENIQSDLKQCKFNDFLWPVISNVTASPYRNKAEIADLLTQQIIKPVQWQATMNYLLKNGITIAIEMGPKNVLTELVKANTPALEGFCYGQADHREELHRRLKSGNALRQPAPALVALCMAAAVATPNHNFNLIEYNKGVVEPYNEILKIQKELNVQSVQPAAAQMKRAFELLAVIFNTKKVPAEEQQQWFAEILERAGVYYLN